MKIKNLHHLLRWSAYSLLLLPALALGNDWQPVTGQEALKTIFSNTVLKGSLPGDEEAVAIYRSDGTGELTAWGDTFTREWKVESEDQTCVLAERFWICYTVERYTENASHFPGEAPGYG